MTLKVAGIWCKTKSDFDKYIRQEEYDLVISHNEIYSRLLKSDPSDAEPSDVIISLYIQKLFKTIPRKFEGLEEVNIAFLFKNLDSETVSNFKRFISSEFEMGEMDLIIINRCDYPKKGVLSLFDAVKFIDHD
jgi:hypothetical protein